MTRTYHNPIITGFHPDPSICRVGGDYYLINSSFEYFPGIPVFHSRDLVNWKQIGHALDRPSQLNLDGLKASQGIYAPTIRFHEGIYYIVVTLVAEKLHNFIITASDPAGPWSDPHWLNDAPGIDPSLLFDDDGKVWYVGNREAADFNDNQGHTEIWLQELNLKKMQLVGEKTVLWDGALKGAKWTEGPHIYKKYGYYYLLTAEGGTYYNHAMTICRSPSITGPYYNCPRNPIITNRHLGFDYAISSVGHADLVETQSGEWWMVALGVRPVGGYYYNLGRETFLMPVIWQNEWPVVSPGSGRVESSYPSPNLNEHQWQSQPACDHFENSELDFQWNFVRTPREKFWDLTQKPGFLRLNLRPETIEERVNPGFIGRRQEHIQFSVRTAMEFTPQGHDECAGIVLRQSEDYHFRFLSTLNHEDEHIIRLIKRDECEDHILVEKIIEPGRIYFKVEAKGQEYSFFYATQSENWHDVALNVDGRILSTTVAGGFVGTYIGLYASSNGKTSDNYADFDWFEYQNR